MKKPFLLFLRKNRLASIALLVIAAIAGGAIFGPALYPYDPLAIDLDSIKAAPSWKHLCGTDSKGRDMLSRIFLGARITLLVSLSAALGSMLIGLIVGLASGFFGGKLDTILSVLVDITMAFPSLLLAIGITVVLPPGIYTVIIALSLVGWTTLARLVRGLTISQKAALFIEASRSIGCSPRRIMFRHILPNCAPTLLVFLSLRVGGFILAESALSFLGLGVQPPVPTWGSMVGLNRIYIHSAPWMVVFPGLAIALCSFACNILGDVLRDYVDPHVSP